MPSPAKKAKVNAVTVMAVLLVVASGVYAGYSHFKPKAEVLYFYIPHAQTARL